MIKDKTVDKKNGKTIMVIVDGAADRPMTVLGGRTAFEAAHTPNLDMLARNGQQGMVQIIDAEICPESDNGAMALLGYDPLKFYGGRGPLEGLGAGFVKIGEAGICFRVNFGSYDPVARQLNRRTARDLTDEDLQALAEEIRRNVNVGVEFSLLAFSRHRGILGLRGGNVPLSGNVSNTDPGFRKQGPFGVPVPDANYIPKPLDCLPLDDTDGAKNTAKVVNDLVRESAAVLARSPVNARRVASGRLPANVLLFRDGGELPKSMTTFPARFGRSLSMYGQIPAEAGLMTLLGGQFTRCVPAPEEAEGDFLERAAADLLRDDCAVVVVHILKSADEAGHDGKPDEKVAAVERFDRRFMGTLLGGMGPSDVCIVTCDHATPCELRIHSADPVPTVVYGKGVPPGGSPAFGERFAMAGGLPVRSACELLPYVFSRGER